MPAPRFATLREAVEHGMQRRGPTECWEWVRGRNGRGFGQVDFEGRKWPAHRAAWTAFVGPISGPLQVRHSCGNRACCNPEHLFLGSNFDTGSNRRYATLLERLEADTPHRPAGGCWEWQGATAGRGYGVFYFQGRRWSAHRASYTVHKGKVPLGLGVRHSCDNPPCWNPAHLSLGTGQQNVDDKVARYRHRPGEQHPMAKLTADQVRAIRVSGERGVRLAERYGVSPATVTLIRKRKTWRGLPD